MLQLRSLLLLTVLFAASVTALSDETREPVPLFADDAMLEVRITAPFSSIMELRSNTEDMDGTLSYQDAEAGEVVLDIGVRTRGRYRRQEDVCSFPPLRLSFSKTKGTLFAKTSKLKLVTHCRTDMERYTQALLKEYIAYRMLNRVTDRSFRVRLLRATYIESGSGEVVDSNYAFLIEHKKQLAKRLDLKVDNSESARVSALDGEHLNLGSVFQYLIGNTDFSPIKGAKGEACCHNYVLMGDKNGTLLSVPYDFDMSGLVSAPYATPNPRFGLRNVRERLYRGRCDNNEHLDTSIRAFQDNREAIFGLAAATPGLSKMYQAKVTNYIGSFYKIIDSPRQVDRRLRNNCVR
jgi:hypothetical protein